MITALPWQLQVCIAEIVLSLLWGLYIVNSKPLTHQFSRRARWFFAVWDATFLALFVTGATHFSVWYLIAAGYYILGIYGHTKRAVNPPEPVDPKSFERVLADGTTMDTTQAVRGVATFAAGSMYLSLLLMVVLG